MSAAATPAPSTAAMTAFVSVALRLSAAAAVAPFVWTVKSNSAWSGTAVTVPVPWTVTVSPVEPAFVVAASAPPASSATRSARATRSFMPDIRCRARRMSHRCQTRRSVSDTEQGLRGGGGRAELAEVLRPAVRDARSRELDEQHRLRRPRRRPQLHARLLQRPVALAQVARRAGGDDILPDGLAAFRTRDDGVEGQPAARGAAVHAAPAVPCEQRPPGDLPLDRPRHTDVGHEPDHVRPDEAARRRSQRLVEMLDHLRLALVDEHVRPPNRADVQRLVAGVQNEDMPHFLATKYQRGLITPGLDRLSLYRVNVRSTFTLQEAIARSTASSSSGERATGERPCSISFT